MYMEIISFCGEMDFLLPALITQAAVNIAPTSNPTNLNASPQNLIVLAKG
jgi:hypothetical protein